MMHTILLMKTVTNRLFLAQLQVHATVFNQNAPTGNAVDLVPVGGDTNIDINPPKVPK